jgi:uncharacterized protein YjbJ (UPF0337 family)
MATACRRRRIAVSAPSDSDRLIVNLCTARGAVTAQSDTSDELCSTAGRGLLRPAGHTRRAQTINSTGAVMNKDQVKGRVEEAKGKIKEVAGRTVGNPDLEDRGTVQKVGGTVQKNYGDLKEDVKDEFKKQR